MCETPSCYGHEQRKARKAHKCCECGGTIQSGEVYHYHHGVWDGEGASFKVCTDCEALRKECDKGVIYPDELTPFTGLIESVAEARDPALFSRWVENRRRRGATVYPWESERVAEEAGR